MRARGVSLVPCLAVAVPALGLESADHHLDREYYPHVHCLASAHAWASVGASWLGHVARIWIGSNRGRNYRASTLQQTGGRSRAPPTRYMLRIGPETPVYHQKHDALLPRRGAR